MCYDRVKLLQRIVTLQTLNYLLLFREKHIGNLALDFSIVKMSFQRDKIKFYLVAQTFNPST